MSARAAVVHLRHPEMPTRHRSGRRAYFAWCGTFSPQTLTHRWREVSCLHCLRKGNPRRGWR